MITRRTLLQTASAAAGASLLPRLGRAQGQRALEIEIVGSSLAIDVPHLSALAEDITTLGYAPCKITRIDQMSVLTQTVIANATEIGDGDAISTMRASAAGADLKIIGMVYGSTSQMYVVNADIVKDFNDLTKPETIVAVNSKGDFTHVMYVGALLKRGLDPNKATVIEMGGSGNRMRAMIAGRIHASSMHVDQAMEVMKHGNYKVMIEPTKEFKSWLAEVWLVNGTWIAKDANKRAATDFLKATIMANRKATKDFAWYAERYAKYLPDAPKAPDDQLRTVWDSLGHQIHTWPEDGGLTKQAFHDLMPIYKAAGAITQEVDIDKVVDTTYSELALKELG